MNHLYQKGLIKEDGNCGWTAVGSLEEQEMILQQRQEEERRTQQLDQEVNLNPPPSIGNDRQRVGQQLEFSEPPV